MKYKVLAASAALVFLGACTSTRYEDPTSVETVNAKFGSTDLQTIATKMTDDLLVSPFAQSLGGERPVVFVDHVHNKTSEHIDTEAITDSIENKLLNSGKFRFIDMQAVEGMKEQFDYQKDSGFVDPSKAAAFGQHVGAEYMLYGNLSGIKKNDGYTKDRYYKFTLKMVDLETGLLEWTSEKEIRKQDEIRWFGY